MDQSQFLSQVRERAQVLSKNARQNPDEIVDKISKVGEEDEEMKGYLQVIRGSEKEVPDSIGVEEKMQDDSLDLDFASNLASSNQLDFSKERFKVGLAQRRVQKRRRPQSWAWVVTTDNEAVQIKETQEPSNKTINVTIQLDEEPKEEEVQKKSYPQNRFGSPQLSNQLMSDLGNVLKKKKNPQGKPVPRVPTASSTATNESRDTSFSPSSILKSPLSSPRSNSPLIADPESPSQKSRIGRSVSPEGASLVLVTEKDVFGVKESPILRRRMEEGVMQQMKSQNPILLSKVKIDGNESHQKELKEQEEVNTLNVSSELFNAPKVPKKPPPPKPKMKPKFGQSSAMLLKSTNQLKKTEVAKEEEKTAIKQQPDWLTELTKKKRHIGESKIDTLDQSSKSSIESSDAKDSIEPSDDISKDKPLTRDGPLDGTIPSSDSLPEWMKTEFSKLKKQTEAQEHAESNVEEGKGSAIDNLFKKPRVIEVQQPSWIEELNRKKKLNKKVTEDSVGPKETIGKESMEHFDYRSQEEMKQQESEIEKKEADENDGILSSVNEIKAKLTKQRMKSEDEIKVRKENSSSSSDNGSNREKLNFLPHESEIEELKKCVNVRNESKERMILEGNATIKDEMHDNLKDAFKNETSNAAAIQKDIKVKNKQSLDAEIIESSPNDRNDSNDKSFGMKNELKMEVDTVGNNAEEVVNTAKRGISMFERDESEKDDVVFNSFKREGSDIQKNSVEASTNEVQSLDANTRSPLEAQPDNVVNVEEPYVIEDDAVLEKTDLRKRDEPRESIHKEISGVEIDKKTVAEDAKIVQEISKHGELSGKVKVIERLEEANQVDTHVILSSPENDERSGSPTALSPQPEASKGKQEGRTEFPKPLRRKLVRVNSFEQGALSKPKFSEERDKGSQRTYGEVEVKDGIASNEKEDRKEDNGITDKAKVAASKNILPSDDADKRLNLERSSVDSIINKNESHNFEHEMKPKNDDVERKDIIAGSNTVDLDRYKSSMDEGRKVIDTDGDVSSGVKVIKFDGEDSLSSIEVQSISIKAICESTQRVPKMDKEATDIQKEVKDKEINIGERKPLSVKEDTPFAFKESGSLDKKNKRQPAPPLLKKPPAPKPKPKPKLKMQVKHDREIRSSLQKEEDKIIKDKGAVSGEQGKAVEETENLKNIEKNKQITEETADGQHVAETGADKNVKIRIKGESNSKQRRPVSMFGSISTVDNSFPMRERKFSGTKFSMELERKEKSCWFRGALDRSDIKSVGEYEDDVPTWKKQLLAKLKSNESSSSKRLERISQTSDQNINETPDFRSRTVTSPDFLSRNKKVSVPSQQISINEQKDDEEVNKSENDEENRKVPAFLLEFASKKQLKARKESQTESESPKSPSKKMENEENKDSRNEEWV